jgi:peptidoglycan/LPS O-acetylase OafA/YrhL
MGFLRLYLAICVIGSHSEAVLPWQMHSGRQAVQIFYIISGFYIELILSGKYSGKAGFYKSRALRIFPPYFIIALGVGALSVLTRIFFNDWLALSAYFDDPLSRNGVAGVLITAVSNLTVFGQDCVVFLKHDAGQDLAICRSMADSASPLYQYLVLPQAWSIAVEMCFYLAAPFLSRLKTPWLILVILASLGLRLAAAKWLGLNQNPWNYRFFPFEVMHFAYGMLACRLYRRYKNELPASCRICTLRGYLVFVVAALAALWIQRQAGSWAGGRIGTENAMILLMPTWIPAIALLFALLQMNPLDRTIGELSYPIYLVHLAVIELAMLITGKLGLLNVPTGPLSALVSVAAAYLLYQTCLRRLEESRQRRLAGMVSNQQMLSPSTPSA